DYYCSSYAANTFFF
nr:immunoglobulin light chain junction region [Macaca mulatta]MOY09995.1 immunoglobulin light chain junction region [Macaca mulatta]